MRDADKGIENINSIMFKISEAISPLLTPSQSTAIRDVITLSISNFAHSDSLPELKFIKVTVEKDYCYLVFKVGYLNDDKNGLFHCRNTYTMFIGKRGKIEAIIKGKLVRIDKTHIGISKAKI